MRKRKKKKKTQKEIFKRFTATNMVQAYEKQGKVFLDPIQNPIQ
jgi:hypothetical protein